MSTFLSPSKIRFTANVTTLLFVVTIILQLLLAAGILPPTMAWGGRQPVLTLGLRFSSLVAVALLTFFAYVIRRRAGLIGDAPAGTGIKILSWIITAYLFLITLANITSLSAGEKMLFTPISFLLAVSCLLISSSKSES